MVPRILFLCGLVCLIVAACNPKSSAPAGAYTVNDPKDPNTTWRSDSPLDLNQATSEGHCPISLPQQAKNIRFVDFYAGFGGFARYVRFEAPVDVCRKHARFLLNQHNTIQDQSSQTPLEVQPWDFERCESVAREARTGEAAAQASWFDCDAVRKGEMWGKDGSHTPLIFIDLEKGVFYYRCTD